MIVIDAVTRLVPGVLGDEGSAVADSFSPVGPEGSGCWTTRTTPGLGVDGDDGARVLASSKIIRDSLAPIKMETESSMAETYLDYVCMRALMPVMRGRQD